MCRQRNNASSTFAINTRSEEVNQMERGALLRGTRDVAPTVSAESTVSLNMPPPPFPGCFQQCSQTPNRSCKCTANPSSPVVVGEESTPDVAIV